MYIAEHRFPGKRALGKIVTLSKVALLVTLLNVCLLEDLQIFRSTSLWVIYIYNLRIAAIYLITNFCKQFFCHYLLIHFDFWTHSGWFIDFNQSNSNTFIMKFQYILFSIFPCNLGNKIIGIPNVCVCGDESFLKLKFFAPFNTFLGTLLDMHWICATFQHIGPGCKRILYSYTHHNSQ